MPGWTEDESTARLRAEYRCDRCHKYCSVPCRFTGAEFRALVQAATAGDHGPDHGSLQQQEEPGPLVPGSPESHQVDRRGRRS